MINTSREYILCAAIWFDDGKKHHHQTVNVLTGFVVCGQRHHNALHTAHAIAGTETYQEFKDKCGILSQMQGFVTSYGNFIDRKEAAKLASLTGQITKETECLFSEDLY